MKACGEGTSVKRSKWTNCGRDDPKALGRAILKFSNDLLIAREMGEKAKVYITRNWAKVAGVDRLEPSFGKRCESWQRD